VYKFNSSGAFVYMYGKGLVHGPVGVACDPMSGDLFVSSYKDSKVLRFTSDGNFVGVAAGAAPSGDDATTRAAKRGGRARTISSPSGLAFAEDGTLWVASYATGAVTRFNASGGLGRTFWRIND